MAILEILAKNKACALYTPTFFRGHNLSKEKAPNLTTAPPTLTSTTVGLEWIFTAATYGQTINHVHEIVFMAGACLATIMVPIMIWQTMRQVFKVKGKGGGEWGVPILSNHGGRGKVKNVQKLRANKSFQFTRQLLAIVHT